MYSANKESSNYKLSQILSALQELLGVFSGAGEVSAESPLPVQDNSVVAAIAALATTFGTYNDYTADHLATAQESGTLFGNLGATARIDISLPPAAANLRYTAIVRNAYGIRWVANGADVIFVGSAESAPGGTLTSIEIGSVVTLFGTDDGVWFAISTPIGNWNNRTVAMHFDGDNGSTTFIDEIGNLVAAKIGSPSISTAQSKFGGASVALNGANSLAVSTDFDLADNDFYIRFWVRHSSLPAAYKTMMAKRGGTTDFGFIIQYTNANLPQFGWSTDGTNATQAYATATNPLIVDTWHYVEVSRSGTHIYVFFDGNLEVDNTDNPTIFNAASDLIIGQSFGSSFMTGFIDDLEIVVGKSGHVAAYTPPTSAFLPLTA